MKKPKLNFSMEDSNFSLISSHNGDFEASLPELLIIAVVICFVAFLLYKIITKALNHTDAIIDYLKERLKTKQKRPTILLALIIFLLFIAFVLLITYTKDISTKDILSFIENIWDKRSTN